MKIVLLFVVLVSVTSARSGGHSSGGHAHSTPHTAPHVTSPHVTPHPTTHVEVHASAPTIIVRPRPTVIHHETVYTYHHVYSSPSDPYWFWYMLMRPSPVVRVQTAPVAGAAPIYENVELEDSTFDRIEWGNIGAAVLILVVLIGAATFVARRW